MIIQNLWYAAKAVLRGKFVAIKSYLKKQKNLKKQPNLTRKVTRERRTKPNVSRRKEIIKIRAKINEIEMKKTIGINEIEVCSLKR